jgi:hypothetical protein
VPWRQSPRWGEAMRLDSRNFLWFAANDVLKDFLPTGGKRELSYSLVCRICAGQR